ncbi:MAG: alpha/beta fold hydrolase, partial [Blastocatellia bacterium]
GPYWMSLLAADVRGLMHSLEIERAVLAGLSMGGYVTLAFYRNFPDAVRAMILADTRASADNDDGRARRYKSAEKAEREGSAAIAEEMLQVLLGETTRSTRPDIVDRVRRMVESNRPEGIAAAQRGMAARPDSSELLYHVPCPSLVISGSEDTLSPPRLAEALQWRLPHSQLKIVEGAGHLPNIERPEEFNAVLIDFIKRLR